MTPEISIIMLVKNELPHLVRSFPLVLGQDIDHSYEVIVIDSGSEDGSVEFVESMAQEHENVSFHRIAPDEFHHARTRNLGVELSRGQYVVFIGGDAVPKDKLWLKALAEPLIRDESKDIAATYGRQVPDQGTDINNICRITFNYGDRPILKEKGSNLTTRELYFFSTVNCCINRNLVDVPFFDDSVPVNEDSDLSFRIINNGKKILYCHDSMVFHSHNYGNMEILRRYFDNVVRLKKIVRSKRSLSLNPDGRRYILHSMKILMNRPLIDWIRFFQFILCSIIGAKLGEIYQYLPKRLCNALSEYGTV